jgi:hypothetical protein
MSHYSGSVPDTPRKKDWKDQSACRGRATRTTDPWFPKPTNVVAVQVAKSVCFGCPSMIQCAQFALTTNQEEGVWGGLNEAQRRTIRKRYKVTQLEDLETVKTAVYEALNAELNPLETLRDLWDQYTRPLPGGHVGWNGPAGSSFSYRGIPITPKQLAFLVDRGEKPTGIIRRLPECPVVECIHPRHIADNRERCERASAERAAAAQANAQEQYAAEELAS